MVLVETKAKEIETFVLCRGDFKSLGPSAAAAARRDPGLPSEPCIPRVDSSSKEEKPGRRAALSARLTGSDNPLTARVS